MLAGVKPWASQVIRASGLILALAVGAWEPSAAEACSCAPLSFEDQRAEAAAIFEGRVEQIVSDEDGTLSVAFHVTQAWRGVAQERIEVSTASSGAACGFTFEVGQHYLVYATSPESTLRVSLCSRTARMDDAGEDRQLLGSGTIPVDVTDEGEATPHEPPATRAGCASCSVGRAELPATLGPAGIALIALALALRARHAR